MVIAVAVEKADPDAVVPALFAESKCALIVETDTAEVKAVVHTATDHPDVEIAQAAVKWRCEAVLCGPIEKDAFEILSDDGITRLNAAGMTAGRAVAAFLKDKLEYIKDNIGGHGCGGEELTQKLMAEGKLPPDMLIPRKK